VHFNGNDHGFIYPFSFGVNDRQQVFITGIEQAQNVDERIVTRMACNASPANETRIPLKPLRRTLFATVGSMKTGNASRLNSIFFRKPGDVAVSLSTQTDRSQDIY
jgi:hypothetical protein